MSEAQDKTVEFFWDVASPYTYLASTQIEALEVSTGAKVVYRPFLLGGVFKATGNAPPALVQSRALYMGKDLHRWRTRYAVPMKLPVQEVTFPVVSVLPMRVATALDKRGLGKQACHAMMEAYWEKGHDPAEEAFLRAIAVALEQDPDEIMAEAVSPDVKGALRSTTEEAVERGAFGAPTFFVGNSMFFGNDRMDFVASALIDA